MSIGQAISTMSKPPWCQAKSQAKDKDHIYKSKSKDPNILNSKKTKLSYQEIEDVPNRSLLNRSLEPNETDST
jgi:hypothetical protein